MPVSMKAVVPKSLTLDSKKLARVIENALTAIAEDIAVDFETTTETWQRKPDFAIVARPGERVIATTDTIYGYVNDGTRPHIIVPRRARVLAFGTGGSPKTAPRVIGSQPGSRGGKMVFTRRVNHPGTEARAFDETIAKKWQREAPQVLQRAIDSEVR